MNYVNSFIAVAEDSLAQAGMPPPTKGARKSVALAQYEMLSAHPYKYTQEDILFESSTTLRERPNLSAAEKRGLREEFFAKPQACLRASALPKKFGWGFHFDADGGVAIYPVASEQYRNFANDGSLKQMKAMRSSRA